MRRFSFAMTLVLVSAAVASAQTLTRGPLIQNPDALTTTMTIEWWTDVAGNSTVEYGLTTALGLSQTVPQAGSCEIGTAGTCHTVQLTGLLPGTRYYYRLLTNNVQVLATTYFQTFKLPVDTSELYFTILGDWGQGSSAQARVANNQNAGDPPLLMTVGDNAYQNGTQSDWDNNAFISQYENQILRRAVFIPILGNHDVNNVTASNWANSVEIKMHLLPRNAPAGQEERFFSFDDGNAHFVVLDSNPPAVAATQTNWLAADLAATTRKWIFVFLHHTPYSCANGFASLGSSHNVRDAWGPLFEQYGVDIVFDGHDHIYERSKVVDDYTIGGAPGSDGLGTVYVMSGGGGASLDSAAQVDGGGPYGEGFFHSKEYCHWLSNQCPNGVNGQYCSFARFQHAEARIVNDTTLTIKAIDENNVVFDQFSITKNALCGNSTIELGEDCDAGGANGSATSCCSATCQFKAAGTECRPVTGVCDVAETCSGSSATCPPNGFRSSTTVCRSAAGGCDLAESCTGSSSACPNDGVRPSTAVCRSAGGGCDVAESCDGASTACPGDAKASGICRAASGSCDLAESCDGVGNACPGDGIFSGGMLCRAAAGVCDVDEVCTGSSPACPLDTFVSSATTCRAASDVCDAVESCTGSSAACPADGFATNAVVCRGAAAVCDAVERCSGSSVSCPGDGMASSTTVCRPAIGVCDQAETCSGASLVCPEDAFKSSSTECRAMDGSCDVAESCTGSSAACPTDGFLTSSTVCRGSAGGCDNAETCTGGSPACPNDALKSSTTVCRASTGPCDTTESCSGSTAICPADAFASSATVCRAATAGCDVAESCSGSSAECPPDALAPVNAMCRAASGICDAAETCTGAAACPADARALAGTLCRPAAGPCDEAEACTGGSTLCPANTLKASAAVCRAAAGGCDVAETCSGTATSCPANALQPSTFVCRPSAGGCDIPESCSGSSASCPADSGHPDGDEDGICDLDDVCPAEPDATQADGDADGLGDACDPCTNAGPVYAVKARIKLLKLAAPPGDDRFKFSGSMTVPAPPFVDPANDAGVRILLVDAFGQTVLDATIPPGGYDATARAGWKVNRTGTTFTYRNAGFIVPLVEGVYKVVVKRNSQVPGLLKFVIAGKNGSYTLPTSLPITGMFSLDPPYASTNQCGEALFPGPFPPACAFVAPAGTVKCR